MRCFITLLILAVGTMLPIISFAGLGGHVNLVWGDVYGLGFYFSDLVLGGLRSRTAGIVGILIWPFLTTALVFWLCGKVIGSRSAILKWGMAFVLLISLFANLDLARSRKPPFSQLPIFYNMFSVYY
jgi:hypothetical protein